MNELAELESEARRANARNPGAVAKVALGEEGATARDRVEAARTLAPEMFMGGNEWVRRRAGRGALGVASSSSSSTSGGSDFNERLRAGFGHGTTEPVVEEPPSRVPVGDAEGGGRPLDPRGMRLNVARAMGAAIRRARGRPTEIDLFGGEE
jgi:hypothetical protein